MLKRYCFLQDKLKQGMLKTIRNKSMCSGIGNIYNDNINIGKIDKMESLKNIDINLFNLKKYCKSTSNDKASYIIKEIHKKMEDLRSEI